MAVKRKHAPVRKKSDNLGLFEQLRRELFQSELIAPTNVDSHDIQFTRRMAVYRAMLVLMLFSVLVILGETLMTGAEQLVTLGVSGIAAAVLGATLFVLTVRGRVLVPPIITLALNFTVVLLALRAGGDHHLRWLFPLMIALAGLLPTVVALFFGTVMLIALALFWGGADTDHSLADAAALTATWLISLAVMRLLTQHSDELADLALYDPLTGAHNRRYLVPQIERNLADFDRYARISSLLMIDLDHFKRINDEFGHSQGDKVLRAMVALIEDRIRGVDMLYRLGGEEFLVILSEVGSTTAAKIADELRIGIEGLEALPGQIVTVSIGVCDVTKAESAEDWLAKADAAMYSAKEKGRNRVEVDASEADIDALTKGNVPIWR